MTAITTWLEELFSAIPLPLLEVWGRFAFVAGLVLAVCAFGGFTFRLGDAWGFGREHHSWNAKAILAISVTFVLILVAGYLGSFVVLVPGAQTLESLKDLVVFAAILLFGYPALLAVPLAYGLSDLIVEGVPPAFLLDWLPGYFINPACFWVAYQLFGKDPDFRRARTWAGYLAFVLVFMSLEPMLWGYLCAEQFTPEMSYRRITPALVFTTSITWLLAPPALLVALPLARRLQMFWAEIPGHVKERPLGSRQWRWEAGRSGPPSEVKGMAHALPLRLFLLTPFIVLVLAMVALTAMVTLKSAEHEATALAVRLQRERAAYLRLRIAAQLQQTEADGVPDLANLLSGLDAHAFIIDRAGRLLASSAGAADEITAAARARLAQLPQGLGGLTSTELHFEHVTSRPLWRDTWLLYASVYPRPGGADWIVATAMPERAYLAGVHAGRSRSAMVFAIALLLSLGIAAWLAAVVAEPLRRLSRASQALAGGALSERVPVSRLAELGTVGRSFNRMAAQLQASFGSLLAEVETRKHHERELAASENRVQLAVKAADLGVWDWNVEQDRLLWDASMYRLYGLRRQDFSGAYEAWTSCVVPEDRAQANEDVQAALRGEREFSSQFRVRWPDGSIHVLKGVAQTIRAEDGRALRMVGVNWDITEALRAEQELRRHRDHLEELVAERTAAAEAANRTKSAFLANMSHEIRTPMNAILGYAQLLERDESLGEPQRRRLEAIRISGEHLLDIINDVLAMSKIEAGRTTLAASRFDLRALLRQVHEMFAGLLDGRVALGFTLADDLPHFVEADAGKVRQVLINLLGNAAKFTRAGHIQVGASCQALAPERLRVVITVADTGSGIGPEDQARIFRAFEQLEQGTQMGGSGLGLSISRSFARLMGGDVTVTSQPGVGSTFTFSFEARPASAAAETRAQAPLALAPGQSKDNVDMPRLTLLLADVPADLIGRLRTAAVEARAPQLDKLADEVAQHSGAAAERIRALVARYDYDRLLEALPSR
jgi:two-component system, sensor histidine kinase and response regulator